MKLFKSLLLASATGLVAVSGASAADLGAKKPSPVEYVRACYNPLWGTSGGFVIPGTQTCVRVFGQARFDYHWQQQFTRGAAPSGFRGGAIVGLDAITPSEFGNVRAFAQVGLVYRSGNQRTGTGTRQGTFVDGTFAGGLPAQGGTETVFSGFIQFAGFTMGRTASFFDPFFVPEVIGNTFRSAPGNVNQIAYTAALGNGITATVAVEDPTPRRFPVVAGLASFNNGVVVPVNVAQGGIAVPNFVAAVQVDQAWGSAKIAGALTNVRPNYTVGGPLLVGFPAPNVIVPGLAAGTGAIPSTKYGFAVMGALKINLPMLAAGDNFVITGAYGEGALSYIFSNQFGGSISGQTIGGYGPFVGDAIVDPVTGGTKLTKAWAVAAGFQHFWTPTLSSTIFGSYAQYDQPGSNVGVFGAPFLGLANTNPARDSTFWSVGVNTIWQPVRGLNIAGEVAYLTIDPKGRLIDVNRSGGIIGGVVATKGSESVWQARLRVTRDF